MKDEEGGIKTQNTKNFNPRQLPFSERKSPVVKTELL